AGGIEEPALHRVPVVRVAVLRVEEPRLEIEPRVELDALFDPAPRPSRQGESRGQLLLELRLHGGPMELRVVVPADDVKEVSLVEKTGECVKDFGMARKRLAKLPDAFRLFRREPKLAFLLADREPGVFGWRDGDGDEVDDVAVQDQTPRFAVFLVQGVEIEECGELGIEPSARGPG